MTGIVIPALEAFFDYLQTSSAYRALGLREFRGYDGNTLDLDHDTIAASYVPAITVDAISADVVPENQPAGMVLVEVSVELSVIFQAQGPALQRALTDCDDAVGVILDLVNGRMAMQSGLGAGRIIKAHKLGLKGFGPVREIVGNRISGDIAFWRAGLGLSLFQQRGS